MANDLNRCEFIGRVGKIESRVTQADAQIVSLSLATNENWKDKQGQKQEKCTWVNVVIFGKLAEIASEYVEKGNQLYISGKFSVRKWQDKQGQDRYTTEIVVDSFNGVMQMLGSKDIPAGSQAPQQKRATPPKKQAPVQQDSGFDDNFDDDLPF